MNCSVAWIKFHKMYSEDTPLVVCFFWKRNIWGRNEPAVRINRMLIKSVKFKDMEGSY